MGLKIRELPPELLDAAKKELHEDPSRREADIAYIREWLKKQPHIKANPDDQTLISFLRGCKFSLERTKEKLDMYYTMRTALPEFFGERNMKKSALIKELMELGFYFPLPECDPEGRRIYVLRAGLTDPSKVKMEDVFKVNFMMMDVMMREDDTAIVKGIVNLMDMGAMTLGHAAQVINPSLVKKVSTCSEEGYPIRPKGLNFVHTPPMFDTMFNLFSSFSKEKIRKRLYVHGKNFDSLYKNIPQRLLPTEYGGEAGTIKEINDAWIKKLETYHDWFLEDEKCGVDESKRPGKPKTQQDLFGLEGSFRQLNVD